MIHSRNIADFKYGHMWVMRIGTPADKHNLQSEVQDNLQALKRLMVVLTLHRLAPEHFLQNEDMPGSNSQELLHLR